MLTVRSALEHRGLPEPTRTHALALGRRLHAATGPVPAHEPDAVAAALEYLAIRVVAPEAEPDTATGAAAGLLDRMLSALPAVREGSRYRAYVGEWIREGCPDFSVVTEDPDSDPLLDLDLDLGLEDLASPDEEWSVEPDVDDGEAGALPAAPALLPVPAWDKPATRWIAPFEPYRWQQEAAAAWEGNDCRGIVKVVTGAGKTALALLLYARLLDRLAGSESDAQLVVVVPRIELARQWAEATRRTLSLRGLKLGQYHSLQKCSPQHVDILIITQDSARSLLPRLAFDRPVMLVADECHRLGAPAASRTLDRPYTFTLGLSATPRRGGDFGFEEVLEPKLGPIVYEYGYRAAVDDGIIAPFSLFRVKVPFTPEEKAEWDSRSDTVKRLMNGLKTEYPVLRAAAGLRFWQVFGDLARRNNGDERFGMLTAAANERRGIAHFASGKMAVLTDLASQLPGDAKVICFHERIEAADRIQSHLASTGVRAVAYHSEQAEHDRSGHLASFRAGALSWLVACKSLDEGLDIPAVDTVVIAAGTKTARQVIQRLGRALRKKPGNAAAEVYVLEILGVDDETLDGDELSDLREAAESIEVLPADQLGTHVRAHRSPTLLHAATVEAAPAPPRAVLSATQTRGRATSTRAERKKAPTAKKSGLRSLPGRIASYIRTRGPWTGTSGTVSYYDKDSSPD